MSDNCFVHVMGFFSKAGALKSTAGETKERIDLGLVEVPGEGRAHQVCRRSGVQRHPQRLRSVAKHRCGQHSGVSKVKPV